MSMMAVRTSGRQIDERFPLDLHLAHAAVVDCRGARDADSVAQVVGVLRQRNAQVAVGGYEIPYWPLTIAR